ncbi:MAG: hypothetical protein ACKVI4_13685 [Actinomycetales bacterium]
MEDTTINETKYAAPFCAFSWAASNGKCIWGAPHKPPPASADPIGANSISEAKQAAWLLNLAAAPKEATEEDLQALQERLAYFVYLQRTEPRVTSIYKRLGFLGATPCHLGELEFELGDFWGEVDATLSDGNVHRCDMFYWKQVEDLVYKSMNAFLRSLDEAVTNLRGLEPMQMSASAYDDCANVRVGVAKKLAHMLVSRDHCDLKANVDKIVDGLVAPRVKQQRALCRCRAESVQALQRLANLVIADDPKNNADGYLQTCYDQICNAAMDPPPELVEALNARGIAISELTEFFNPQSTVATYIRHELILNWAWRVGPQVVEACNSTLSVLRRFVETVETATEWSNIHVAQLQDVNVQELLATQAFRTVGECPLPNHTSPLKATQREPVLYVSNAGGDHALRTVRMLRALQLIVRADLIPSYTVRADFLLPIFARVKCEQRATYSSIAASCLQPYGKEHGVDWPLDSQLQHVAGRAEDDGHDDGHDEAACQPTPPPAPAMLPPPPVVRVVALRDVKNGAIPPALKRDSAILTAILRTLTRFGEPRQMKVRPSELAGVVTQIDTDIHANPASLNQACGRVAKKIVTLCVENATGAGFHPGLVTYSQERPRGKETCIDGLSVDTLGAQTLHRFILVWLDRMKDANKTVIAEWGPSRSSRQYATSLKRTTRKSGGSSKQSDGAADEEAGASDNSLSLLDRQSHKQPRQSF